MESTMTEPTRAPNAPTIPTTFAWCSWCEIFAGTCRLVQIIEQGSGPGGGLFACEPCRAERRLVPVADQPL
jgi:hypothetical protein